MKKILLSAILAFAFCGAIFAQTSHWADYNSNMYMLNAPVVAFVQVDNEFIEATGDWADVEVAAFVNGVCRGHMFMDDYTDDGDPHPIVELTVDYTNRGEAVTFQMYNHATETLYENCTSSIEILTGDAHDELYENYDWAVVLNFSAGQTFTKDIVGVGEDNWNGQNGGYYLIASPITEDVMPADDNGFITNTFDLYYFDQAQNMEWVNFKADAEDGGGFTLANGKGYLYASMSDTQLTFTGTPYDGNGEVTLVKDDNANLSGWNLVGNPFAEEAFIDKPYYTLNTEGSEVMSETSTAAIAPMEGVFVIAEQNGEVLTFSTELVNAGNTGGSLALNLTQGRGTIDRAIVNFGNGSLPKFQLNPNHTKVYIPQDGKDYAVVSAGEMGEMPVSFKAEKNGSYSLSFTCQEVSFSYLHLIDNMTGSDVNLLETPSYTFNAQTTDYASRFRLVFATSDSADSDSFGFISGNGSLCIFGIEGEATVQVVDVLGHILSSETFSGSYEKSLNAAPGVYMIRLIQGNDVKVQKMVVK